MQSWRCSGRSATSLVALTVRVKLHVPVSSSKSLVVPLALYVPADNVAGAEITPVDETFRSGAPFDWV